MTAREIVHDPNVMGGRWHFSGTGVAIAAVRQDHKSLSERDGSYRYMNLTDEEIARALAFDFPAVRSSELDVQYASVTMHCVCGEDTPHATTWPGEIQVECPCGRVWLVTVNFRLLEQQQMDGAV
jgi:uncharacterized protein (DUF433 family)